MSTTTNYRMNLNIYKELKEDLENLGLKDDNAIEDVIIGLLKDYVREKNAPKPMTSEELNNLFDDKFWDN